MGEGASIQEEQSMTCSFRPMSKAGTQTPYLEEWQLTVIFCLVWYLCLSADKPNSFFRPHGTCLLSTHFPHSTPSLLPVFLFSPYSFFHYPLFSLSSSISSQSLSSVSSSFPATSSSFSSSLPPSPLPALLGKDFVPTKTSLPSYRKKEKNTAKRIVNGWPINYKIH